jgi:hypothetical protein
MYFSTVLKYICVRGSDVNGPTPEDGAHVRSMKRQSILEYVPFWDIYASSLTKCCDHVLDEFIEGALPALYTMGKSSRS